MSNLAIAIGIIITIVLTFMFIVIILMPSFLVTVLFHTTIGKRYDKKIRWILSISIFVGVLILWLLFIIFAGPLLKDIFG